MKNSVPRARPLHLGGPWRWLLPLLLVSLFLAVLLWLPWQARQMESNERQEQLIADTLWVEQALRFELTRNEEAFTTLAGELAASAAPAAFQARMDQMRKSSHELLRLSWLDEQGKPVLVSGPEFPALLAESSRNAADLARKTRRARYSETYSAGQSLLDHHLPVFRHGQF